MSNVPIFVDLQGFVFRNNFTAKEIAVLRDGQTLSHYIFREPVPWNFLTRAEKSEACWLKLHHHGFRWDDGYVPYCEMRSLVRAAIGADPPLIYVKGLEKRRWLRQILDDDGDDYLLIETIDADYDDVARLTDMDASGTLRCGYHARHCAMRNVCKLYKWWRENNV